MHTDGAGLISSLNLKPEYDGTLLLNNYLVSDNDNPLNISLSSEYFDSSSFTKKFGKSKKPIYISVNIQSLMSKFEALKLFIQELLSSNVPIDVIVLQETWSVKYPELVQIPCFQNVITMERADMRGGGVGMYIREGLHFNKIVNLSTFTEKTFESLTVELQYPNKKILISTIYRSPNPPPLCSVLDHTNRFIQLLDRHLNDLFNRDKLCVIFLDSNVNLHSILNDPLSLNYLNTITSNGFIQAITKSTRIQGNSHSLIDHILINKNLQGRYQGIIVSDISDHFFTFYQMNTATEKTKQQIHSSRKITMENMERFKLLLRGVDWSRVYGSNVVDESFDAFWTEFSQLYELCFPVTMCKLNRNIHRINGYMTPGLLISRISKNNLHKNSLLNPTPENINRFRVYRNLYNTLMRKSKAKYFEENLLANVKNPKKTWDLLKEATWVLSKAKKFTA